MGLTLGAPEAWAVPGTPFANLVMDSHELLCKLIAEFKVEYVCFT
jgi:hypothetical protein